MSKLMEAVQATLENGQEVDFLIKSKGNDFIQFEWITSRIPHESLAKAKQADAGYMWQGYGFSGYKEARLSDHLWSCSWKCFATCD